MLAVLICMLTLQQVHSACNVPDMCPDKAAVQNEIVSVHNAFRRAVQPTASDMLLMSYSEEVAVSAQAWVDKCKLAHGEPSNHMLNGYVMGENLFYSAKNNSWTDIINAFHSEVEHYLYPNGSTDGEAVGHYTQVVWNSSYKVGCGMTMCPNNIYYYSCHYFRAGNFKGIAPYKAGPPCASCPNNCEDKLCTNPCPHINKHSACPIMKEETGCGNILVAGLCPASCKCATEIIPIA